MNEKRVAAAAEGLSAVPVNSRFLICALLAVLLLVILLFAVSIGIIEVPLSALLSGRLDEQQATAVMSLRLPRVLLSAFVGAALAVSGAAMQGMFRNPLADPSLIGIASGAALAVALAIVVGVPLTGFLGLYGLSFAAFIGGLLACLLIFYCARASGSFVVTYMLLAGIAVNAFAASATGFLIYSSDDQQLRTLTFWTMGGFGNALWPSVVVCAGLIAPSVYFLLRNAREINVLLFGDEEARYLGVNSERLQRRIVVCTAVAVGAAVAVSGIIGFVGLVVPHLIRITVGSDHRLLLPASALLGAILLTMADTFARSVLTPLEVPVGVLTGLVGGPFFLWLLFKQYGRRAPL